MLTMKVDFLIIGQGLAGSLLAHFLETQGASIYVIDPDGAGSASRRAAGLINPVTGRYFVKSWRVDELIPFARETYRALEQQLGGSFFHDRCILRALGSAKEENDWLARAGDPGYQAYMGDHARSENFQTLLYPTLAYGQTLQSAQLNVAIFLDFFQKQLTRKNRLSKNNFHYVNLKINDTGVVYQEIEAKGLIFCEGFGAIHNPFFNYLPFRGDKGEALIVKIPGVNFEQIVKQNNTFIAPLGNDLYWVGATYAWHFENDIPTEKARLELLERLDTVLKMPYEVIDHWAAIRPTVKDRRPFLGQHPQFPQLWIFNGLGTKGASLAPFWAHHLSEVIVHGATLDPEVDITRFKQTINSNQK